MGRRLPHFFLQVERQFPAWLVHPTGYDHGHDRPPGYLPESLRPAGRPVAVAGVVRDGYFDPSVSLQLKQMALEEDCSVQRLLGEALDLLFQSRGKPTIAH